MQKVYFLSTGRCATNFLYKFFNKYYPETQIQHQKKWSRIINIISNLPLSKRLKVTFIDFIFSVLRKEIVPNSTVDPLLSYALYLKFKENYPECAKIIHLVRSADSFSKSFLKWINPTLKKKILHSLIPFWMPIPNVNEINLLKWIKMSKYEKFCWVWSFKNKKFNELSKKNNYMLIRLEDLMNPKKSELTWNSMLQFISLESSVNININDLVRKKINQSEKSNNSIAGSSKKEKETYIKYCQPLMNKFGYI